jgi:FixJ family two-component response regulator
MTVAPSVPTVFIVDDDEPVRRGLARLMRSAGLNVETHAGGRAFLDSYEPGRAGCLVLDMCMPGMSGHELQDLLLASESDLPVIAISAFADVPMAVRTMRSCSVDFFEKPLDDQKLLEAVQRAIRLHNEILQAKTERAELHSRFSGLTPRERQVLDLVISGHQNRAIAAELGVGVKTVEMHRGRVMDKTRASNVADLVRMAILSGYAST